VSGNIAPIMTIGKPITDNKTPVKNEIGVVATVTATDAKYRM